MAIIIPEVFADAVNKALGVKLRVGKLATDYSDDTDITLCGSTVHFPMINRIGDAATVVKGTPIVPDEVDMTDSEAEIKQVAKSARVYDKDSVQVKGNLKDKLAEQIGDAMAKAVDADLISAIRTDAAYKYNTASLSVAMIDSAFDCFGDDIDNDTFAGIIIHPALRKALMALDAFTDATKTYAANGNGVVKDGVIGYWNGTIPVYVTNNGTRANNKNMFAIVKKDALGVIWQRNATTEEERESKLLATDIVAQEMYATKLIHTDGVAVIEVWDGTFDLATLAITGVTLSPAFDADVDTYTASTPDATNVMIAETIIRNPAQIVPLPKQEKQEQKGVFLNIEQANALLEAFRGHELQALVYTTLYYGLRRSEVLGLKWDAVDFVNNTLTIQHTIVKNRTIVAKDTTKSAASHRTYPLLPQIKEVLIDLETKQEQNRALFGKDYHATDYIFAWEDGTAYRPDYVTRGFQRCLKNHGLPRMRFHDLRHSTASILYDRGWNLKDIQEWLGHADIEITGNIYTHISNLRKSTVGKSLDNAFHL